MHVKSLGKPYDVNKHSQILNYNQIGFTPGAQTVLDAPGTNKIIYSMACKYQGADQPAHPRSLISAIVVQLLERIVSKLAKEYFTILTVLCC